MQGAWFTVMLISLLCGQWKFSANSKSASNRGTVSTTPKDTEHAPWVVGAPESLQGEGNRVKTLSAQGYIYGPATLPVRVVREKDIQDTVLVLLAIPGPEKPTKTP